MLNIQQTDNPEVARMAIAFSIANRLFISSNTNSNHGAQAIKEITAKYIEVYNAILKNEQAQSDAVFGPQDNSE